MPLTKSQSLFIGKGISIDTTAADLEKRLGSLPYEVRIVTLSVTERANAFYLVAVIERV